MAEKKKKKVPPFIAKAKAGASKAKPEKSLPPWLKKKKK